jgi:predicted small lipoprotein YifL
MNKKILIFPLLLSLAGCATKGDLNRAQQDIEEMKTRLILSEKNISAVKIQAKEIAEQSSGEALKNRRYAGKP